MIKITETEKGRGKLRKPNIGVYLVNYLLRLFLVTISLRASPLFHFTVLCPWRNPILNYGGNYGKQ